MANSSKLVTGERDRRHLAVYHLHVPWVIPQTLLVDTFAEALPSRRYRSSLIGIAVHNSQTVFFTAVALALVLR